MSVVPLPKAAMASPLTWPIPGDQPDIEVIIADQALTIAAQAALIDAYQAALATAQNPPPGAPGTGTGTTSGASTTLSVNSTGGTIVKGATIAGTGIPTAPAPTVLGQISGTTGGTGSYLISAAVTLATATALTFTPPPPATTWPTPSDAPTLMLIQQAQTAILRMQSSLLQNYQDLLNLSQTPAPPTGP